MARDFCEFIEAEEMEKCPSGRRNESGRGRDAWRERQAREADREEMADKQGRKWQARKTNMEEMADKKDKHGRNHRQG
ncbi:hypothetical protein Pmani_023063 [Petrolisthes manimaculis]|uniref:Uncharacterized protein n=1 Tax=Petrolisthes manimaculis TaxID=1843537 RepID=A0AAE1PBG9_9EUCA|nr:hypothetical protein Pmani_023063 [Petrolisthes manimaculis]